MKSFLDSRLCLALAVLLVAVPAYGATAKKPVKAAAAKPPAVVVEPQPDAATLIAKSREAQNRGETELALRLAQSAIVASPKQPSTYNALADVYAAINQPDFARSYYSVALSIEPTDMAALQAMAALDRAGSGQQAAKMDAEGTKTGTP